MFSASRRGSSCLQAAAAYGVLLAAWQNVGLADLGASIKDLPVLLTSHFSLVNVQKSEQSRRSSQRVTKTVCFLMEFLRKFISNTIRNPDPWISWISPPWISPFYLLRACTEHITAIHVLRFCQSCGVRAERNCVVGRTGRNVGNYQLY